MKPCFAMFCRMYLKISNFSLSSLWRRIFVTFVSFSARSQNMPQHEVERRRQQNRARQGQHPRHQQIAAIRPARLFVAGLTCQLGIGWALGAALSFAISCRLRIFRPYIYMYFQYVTYYLSASFFSHATSIRCFGLKIGRVSYGGDKRILRSLRSKLKEI